jgi:Family of unknown function (DUF6516)
LGGDVQPRRGEQIQARPILLLALTTTHPVGTLNNMKATELLRRRIPYSEVAFAELVLWQLPAPISGSTHSYKYRLAFVVNGICVLGYDNELGKGDHRHFRGKESRYAFDGIDKLLAAFQRDIERINREDSDA